jgi:exodeoxyribonuclease VII large subunit
MMDWDLFSSSNPEPAPNPPKPARAQSRQFGAPVPIVPASAGRTYTVSGLNALVKQILEDTLPPVWVSGEVTNWKRHTNGHCYFSLRDSLSQIRCVMFRAEAQRLPILPVDGLKVRALGRIEVYEKRGEFQLVVHELDAQKAGGLWRIAFEKLKEKLEGEGLLAPERKRPLPRFPETVGVITSPAGAALHDVLKVIEHRAPWTRVVFCPAKVQGEGAAVDIARAIRLFSKSGVADVLIVGRGGGSVEDLWAFNEEIVARAIVACTIPVISAVGHEVDITIADLVADMRAPTPSAAAERAVPDGNAMLRQLGDTRTRLRNALGRRATRARAQFSLLGDTLEEAIHSMVRERRERMRHAAVKLEVLSPLASMRRGYAVPLDTDGKLKRNAASFEEGEHIRLRVVDGEVACTVNDVTRKADAVLVDDG